MARACDALRFSVRLACRCCTSETTATCRVVAGHEAAGLIAGAGLLDLDDVGAELRELLRREWPGEYLSEVDHSNAVERERQEGIPVRNY